MRSDKGFTMMEIIVAMIIVSIGAVIGLNLFSNVEQTNAQTARNQLLAVVAAQEKYFEDNSGAYYYNIPATSTPSSTTTAALFSALGISQTQGDPFNYVCYTPPAPYTCLAKDGTDTLTLTYTIGVGAAVTCSIDANGNNCFPNG